MPYRCVPESVRWLRIQDKNAEAERILKKVAKINNKRWPNARLSKPLPETTKSSFKDICCPFQIGLSTFIQGSSW